MAAEMARKVGNEPVRVGCGGALEMRLGMCLGMGLGAVFGVSYVHKHALALAEAETMRRE